MAFSLSGADALVVVDVQNDFLPGGSLAVARGDRVIEPLNRLMPRFRHVYATRDWHPRGHASFSAQGGPWPNHCIQDTPGAEFSRRLDTRRFAAIVSKRDGSQD